MREINLLKGYPEPSNPRIVGPKIRTIENRIAAAGRGKEFFDGKRDNGYGGYKYDGRWLPIAKNIISEYNLDNNSSILQVGCEKGFLLNDLKSLLPSARIAGTESAAYPIETSMETVRDSIVKSEIDSLPFDAQEFDLIIAINIVYTKDLNGVLGCLREIERVKKKNSYITLGSYENSEEKQLFEWWTLLGTTILHRQDWLTVMQHVGYSGDYKFTDSKSLKLETH
tara:strand:- start:115 stop:792 length:678 start_codon:yes stop_codon:yes gene_type:complete